MSMNDMNDWEILQIEATDDLNIVKKAYARLIKQYKPHQHPNEFEQIRAAYENIITKIQGDDILLDETNELQPEIKDNLTQEDQRYKIIQAVTDVYLDINSRNCIDTWHKVIQTHSEALLADDESFSFIMSFIIRHEYLYRTELHLNPEIYILLFDFYNIDEFAYIKDCYSQYVSEPLIELLRKYKHATRLQSIIKSSFNAKDPELQIVAENFYATQLKEDIQRLEGNVYDLAIEYRNMDPKFFRVLGNIAFKKILDKRLDASEQNDDLFVAQLYSLFRFNFKKWHFCRIMSKIGYNKQDVINCLNYAREMYRLHLELPLWRRVISNFPPFAFIVGLCIITYSSAKKFYKFCLPNRKPIKKTSGSA